MVFIKKTMTNFSMYLGGTIIISIISFISVPIYTRIFNPADYGFLSLTTTTISLLGMITYGGITPSIIRYLPIYKDKKSESIFCTTLFFLSLFITFLITSLFLIILTLLRSHINPNLFRLMIFGSLLLILTSFKQIFLSIFRANQKAKTYSIFMIFNTYIGFFIGLYFIIKLKTGIIGIIFGSILSLFILNIIIYIIYLRKKIKLKIKFLSKKIAREIIYYGFPLIFSLFSWWVLNLSDRYMIELFRGSFEVGQYSVGYTLTQKSINILVTPFITALSPAVIHLWNKNRDKAKYDLQILARYFLIICVPAVVGLNLLSPAIFSIITTPQYYAGQKVVLFVSSGVFFYQLYCVAYTGLIIYKKTTLIAKIISFAAISNFILNLFLIPKFGFVGAGISTFLSFFCAFVIADRYGSQLIEWKPSLRSIINIILATIGMSIIVFVLKRILIFSPLNIIIEILFGCFSYFIFLFVIKEIKDNEKKEIKNIVQRYTNKILNHTKTYK